MLRAYFLAKIFKGCCLYSITMEEQKMEKPKKEMLKCDHCGERKQCQKIVYNKFGNVIFICDDCIVRSNKR